MTLPVFVSETLHHEAIDWATRASANGGAISTTTIRVVSDLCRSADRDGWRSAMYRLNPFAGGNLSGCLVPLFRGPTFGGTNFGNATDTNVNFVSGDYSETGATGGLKGNGTTKYLNTGLAPNALPSVTNLHQSASATSAATSGNAVFMASYNGTAAGMFSLDDFATAASARAYRCGNFTVGQYPTVTATATEAHMIGTRTSATSAVIYRGGSSAASNATSVTPTATAVPFIVFALTTSSGFSASRLRMYSIGTGLTAAQAAAFSAAVIAFNADLGR